MHRGRCRRCRPVAHDLYPALSDWHATMGYMCGRFAVTTDPALLAEKIQAIDESTASTAAQKDTNSGPNYNVAPTTSISAVVKRHTEPDDESTRRVRVVRWGLGPPGAQTAGEGGPRTKGPRLVHARSGEGTAPPRFPATARQKGGL